MKKFIPIPFVLLLTAFCFAETIDSVAFHPSPTGNYDVLNISKNLELKEKANINFLEAKGSLTVKGTDGGAGTIVVGKGLTVGQAASLPSAELITPKLDITGTSEVDVKGNAKIAKLANDANTKAATFNAQNVLTCKVKGQDSASNISVQTQGGGYAAFPSASASGTLRWVEIQDISGGKHMILVEQSAGTANCKANDYCCIDPSSTACLTSMKDNIAAASTIQVGNESQTIICN
ncbi:hypothetical protein Emin_0816 [Elusimicrobium minutum Pei191]|uniref:Uncharacterized protein n=1 Tax=Elusimicrobium minutum (strain Pei191) TaxID=445932 RepID=B2KCX5_ELUMP|nr:hypothetical protein [Elusimicrobium minutum]ACC98371.1 hypothetical protein Emin_0816 [Elusimicrobium minutum Pei191]